MQYDSELINGFIDETRDILEDVEPTLIELSQDSGEGNDVDSETVNSVFRLFHSLKSSAAFLGFPNIANLTHEAETVLQEVREGDLSLNSELTTVLCNATDLIGSMLENIENEHNDKGFEDKIEVTCNDLQAFLEPSTSNVASENKATASENVVEKEEIVEVKKGNVAVVEQNSSVIVTEDMIHNFVAEGGEQIDIVEECFLTLEKDNTDLSKLDEAYRSIHSFKGNSGFMHFVDLMQMSHLLETIMDGMRSKIEEIDKGNITFLLKIVDMLRDAVSEMENDGDGSIPDIKAYMDLISDVFPTSFQETPVVIKIEKKEEIVKEEVVKEVTKVETIAEKPEKKAVKSIKKSEAPAKKKRKKIERQDIRVELSKLDSIINLVGELVISESMVTRNPAVKDIDNENYYRATHQLRRICNELQDASMSLRMVPLAGIFKKMVRVVHDLSRKMNKPIRLDIIGGETEVDKTVIESLSDPLVHIIRNSCDHGLEDTADRAGVGKEETGVITIEGRHEGGEVWIIIKDDGAGLNRDRILGKAIENGIVSEDEASDMLDEDIWRLIFNPGFSTADAITDVSGRGVGMDVVKKNIEKLNGRIDVKTASGLGTSLTIRIPLTLAIIDGMLIKVGNSKYTIPTLSIKKSLRVKPGMITTSPEGGEILKIGDQFTPILRLSKLFNQKDAVENIEDGIIIIVDDSSNKIALFADEIIGQQQTVIKGLSQYINTARGASGCTILGDGSVALIIDVKSLVNLATEQAEQGILQ